MICTLDYRLPSFVTGAWGANTFLVRKQLPNPHFQNTQTIIFLVFFLCFPRINVSGDSTHFPSTKDAPLARTRGLFHAPRRRVGRNSWQLYSRAPQHFYLLLSILLAFLLF